MIKITKKLLAVVLCASFATAMHADSDDNGIVTGSPYFFTRSQSRNKVLQDVASIGFTHLEDDCWYGTFDVVVAYERSFRSGRIADALFGLNGTGTFCPTTCNTVCNTDCNGGRAFKVQGSAVVGRDPNAWLADYFYLPTDFNSTISFRPRITNTLIFLDYYQGMDSWFCGGTYFRIFGPITFSRWDLEFCENVINRGTTGYNTGYFSPVAIPANTLLPNFSSYAAGDTPAGLAGVSPFPNTSGTASIGVAAQPLKYAKLRKESHKKTGFADLRWELGWDFWQTPCYHLGVNIQGAAPTGSRPDSQYTFQPVVGNGKHWELGAGLTGHYTFWMNESETQSFSFWVDANFTHLFSARQQRTFDLRGKPVSRYMLAERMGPSAVNPAGLSLLANVLPGVVAGGVTPALQFQGEFAPVANLTTTDVKVSIGVQADIVAWFNYTWCDWSFDLGYNFWGTSCEKIRIDTCENDCKNPQSLCNPSQANTWALKGDAQVYGFTTAGIPVALSATESGASITAGTNVTVGAPVNSALSTNLGVDAAAFAQATTPLAILNASVAILTTQVRTSLTPVTLACTDIDFTRNKGLTHKIFGHANYTWERECWVPYLGIGGSAEFAQRNNGRCDNVCNTNTSCNTRNNCDTNGNCVRSAASLWSVWVKGGVAFN